MIPANTFVDWDLWKNDEAPFDPLEVKMTPRCDESALLATAEADAAVDTLNARTGEVFSCSTDSQTAGLIAKYEDEMSERRNEMKNMSLPQVISCSSSQPPAPVDPPPAAATTSQRTTIRVSRKEIIPMIPINPRSGNSQEVFPHAV
jgi:hypothetical protein